MMTLHDIFNAFLLATQVILSFSAAFLLLTARQKRKHHSYIAGFISSLWAGGMLSYGVWSVVMWPLALDSTSIREIVFCGLSFGLAWYSGGSIFKVIRLCRRLCN